MAASRSVPVATQFVRRASVEDGPALFGAWQRMRQHNAEVDRRYIPSPITQSDFIADLREILGRPQSAAFVAEARGALAGFISGSIERNLPDRLPEKHATIGYLWVEEGQRRKGIARALFGAVAEWAMLAEDVAHFEMAVLSADEAAAEFWRAIGFTPFIERLWAPLSAPERDE